MNDRDLLELAAKAADIPGDYISYTVSFTDILVEGIGRDPLKSFASIEPTYIWNPLTNDGDALRLAVKCKIMIDPSDWGLATAYWSGGHLQDECYRRAIVRAAAEIGKLV